MSGRKPKTRQPGQPVYAAQRPGLRLVPTEPTSARPEPVPELCALIADMQRRHRVQRERPTIDPDEPEAA